jgi:hypothetical protein
VIRTFLDARSVLAAAFAALVGIYGLRTFPVQREDLFLAVIEARRPEIAQGLAYGYAFLWFSTPFCVASLATSLVAIVASRHTPSTAFRKLPPYPAPESRPAPSLVLGETHFIERPGRASNPGWLTIPQRGLYTGVMVLGAVGTGKTSACMYPYVDQLLRWRVDDADRKVGALVMEVKGDFCRQVRAILKRAGRADDYVEVGLDTGVSYNPLHNDLDPYAVAYAIATLLNNLFGKSKEPFWQQAYTDLLKFVILLRRMTDGYTTFAEVYRYILDDQLIDRDIRRLKTVFRRRHVGASIQDAWTDSLACVRAALDADSSVDRAMLLRASAQEIAPTRDRVIEAVTTRLDLPQKHAAEAYSLADQYESNPRCVWGYVQGLTRLSQRTPWQDGRFVLDRAASRLLTTVQ